MKKTIALLTILAAFTSNVFAETGVSLDGRFGIVGTESNAATAEINIKSTLDDYTTVEVELDAEGSDWNNKNISLDDFRISSNVAGALGIEDFDFTVTTGMFDTYFSNSNYVSRTGGENAHWGTNSPSTDLAVQGILSLQGYNIMYWQALGGSAMNFAISGTSIDALSLLVAYSSNYSTFNKGNFAIEGAYSINNESMELKIPLTFSYGLNDNSWHWNSGVALDIESIHFSAGFGGNSTNNLTNIIGEVSTSMVENADLYALVYADAKASTPLQSIDLGASYKFGKLKLAAGYVVAIDSNATTSVWGGNGADATGNAFYFYFDF